MVGILTKSEGGECIRLVFLFIMLPESGVVGVGSVNRSLVWLGVTAILTSADWSENVDPSSDGLIAPGILDELDSSDGESSGNVSRGWVPGKVWDEYLVSKV